MYHSRSLKVTSTLLSALLVTSGHLWSADSPTIGQPPRTAGWLESLRVMVRSTAGRPLAITHSNGKTLQAVKVEMEDQDTIKATGADGGVVRIKLVDVQQMETQ